MKKQLKKWNGRGAGNGQYKNGHTYVAAFSKKQAAELINQALEALVTVYEIDHYYAPCWGNAMNGIEPLMPCVYVTKDHTQKPIKLL
jgi:hypothetical protein